MSDKVYWRGEYMNTTDLYARGMDDERKRAGNANRASLHGVTEQIKSIILEANTKGDNQPPPTWWPQFTRAAEHIVWDPTGAATPSGSAHHVAESQLPQAFSDSFVSDAMPVLRYTRLIEALPGVPIPALPILSTQSTAGPRAGEKLTLPSSHYDITAATATEIDAGLYLNISQVLIDIGYGPLNDLIMKAAVAAAASSQIAQAIETAAGAGGLANFDGRYVPSVVVVPPANLETMNANNYVAAGMTVVIDPSVTQTLVLDPNAVIGWFRQGRMENPEPSLAGVGVAFNAYGRVAVDSAGVAALAPAP